MEKGYLIIALLLLLVCSCSGEGEPEGVEITDSTQATIEDTTDAIPAVNVPELQAVVDEEAMNQVGQYTETSFSSSFELYHSGHDIVERWTDKLWGRCCTEADMSLCEYMRYEVSTSSEGSKYPWENALTSEDAYNTAYVFKPEDNIEIKVKMDLRDDQYLGSWGDKGTLSSIIDSDTVMSKFQFSLINGYVKSEKTFKENGRIEWVELWLNGTHQCNVKLLDTPEIQMIEGNFPFFKDDVVIIKPITYYKGTKYDDICLSTVQTSLGYSCDLDLLKKGDKLAGITWRGYEDD